MSFHLIRNDFAWKLHNPNRRFEHWKRKKRRRVCFFSGSAPLLLALASAADVPPRLHRSLRLRMFGMLHFGCLQIARLGFCSGLQSNWNQEEPLPTLSSSLFFWLAFEWLERHLLR